MSTVKAKLNEVAKDIEVSNQELIDLLSDLGIKGKKATASLNEEELNLILETYSKKHEVTTFEDYLKKGEEERKLWERYSAFAVAFGLNTKMAEKVPEPLITVAFTPVVLATPI